MQDIIRQFDACAEGPPAAEVINVERFPGQPPVKEKEFSVFPTV